MSVEGALTGRRILVSGASSGIGEAVARTIVAQGGRAALLARRADRLQAISDELGDRVLALECDVTDRQTLTRVVAEAAGVWDGLDGVVAAAGRSQVGSFLDGDPDRWLDLIDLNLVGALTTARAALDHFSDTGVRDVIFISSSGAHTPIPGVSIYAASKRGLHAAFDGIRLELAQKQIRTSIVSPGYIATEVIEHSEENGTIPVGQREPGHLVTGSTFVPAAQVGAIVGFMLAQPEGTCLNEVVIRPTGQLRP